MHIKRIGILILKLPEKNRSLFSCTVMSVELRFILAPKCETEISTALSTGDVPTRSRIVHLRDIDL